MNKNEREKWFDNHVIVEGLDKKTNKAVEKKLRDEFVVGGCPGCGMVYSVYFNTQFHKSTCKNRGGK